MGCFGYESTVVVVRNGVDTVTQVGSVRAGDEVRCAGGTAVVRCVVRSATTPGEQLVSIPGGPTLTLTHPVRIGGQWQRPGELGPHVPCTGRVYNFVLDRNHVLLVDGYECCTFGHGIEGPVIGHDFYGTDRIVDCLQRLPGWQRGDVCVAKTVRNADGRAVDLIAEADESPSSSSSSSSSPAASRAPASRAAQALCSICLDAPSEVLLVPCGHQCGCQPCLESLHSSGNAKCPICRTDIERLIKVIQSGAVDADVGLSDCLPPAASQADGSGVTVVAPEEWRTPPAQLRVSTSVGEGAASVLVQIEAPEATGSRAGVDIVCVVDISGSMGTEATYETDDGQVHSDGLTVLCIAKHAVKVCIATLGPLDRIGIVAFDQAAQVVLPLVAMSPQGRLTAIAAVESLQPRGQTNIWGGLSLGMDALRAAAPCSRNADGLSTRVQTVLLLTDGLPNIKPADGHIAELRKYRARYPDFACQLVTFGFGYGLDSQLLLELASAGHGTYAFIPTAPVMGTVFVHALANIVNTHTPRAQLHIRPSNGATLNVDAALPGQLPVTRTDWGAVVDVGPLQYGQIRDVVVPLTIPPLSDDIDDDIDDAALPSYLDVTLEYGGGRCTTRGTARTADPDADIGALRALFIDTCLQAVAQAERGRLARAHSLIQGLAGQLAASPYASDERLMALRQDVEGRVTKSFDGLPRFNRWGKHYVRALCRAHGVQHCTNPLDKGLQVYGSSLFVRLRDYGNSLFLALPAPRPPLPVCPLCNGVFTLATIQDHCSGCFGAPSSSSSAYGGAASVPLEPSSYALMQSPVKTATPPPNMEAYTTNFGGCFDASATVTLLLPDGARRRTPVADVRAGDRLLVAGNSAAHVLCVVRSCQPPDQPLAVLSTDGPALTLHHPVRTGSRWQPAGALTARRRQASGPVYNFVLDRCHVLLVDGHACCTLGHGLTEAGVAHSFYGTGRIVDCLRRLPGWSDGLVRVAKIVRTAQGQPVGLLP